MSFYADLHLHSKFARATSSDADLEHMALWAAKKGVTVLGTGDFTHPGWWAEIRAKLVPAEPGLFRLRPELESWVAQQYPAFGQRPTRFLLEVEISTIYKKGDRTRKVHHCHYLPDLATAERFIARLARIGNLNADGRPILGLDSRDLLEITLEAGEGAYLIPAHIWTPWFAVLGSKSGFDSIEECYGDLTPHIFALETGLSSDPPMNWRLSQLDRYQLVSNSDAHSPPKIGREACAFDCALDYGAIRDALMTGRGYEGTVEFFPEEGKYHLDGHRHCGVCFAPEVTKQHGGLCPTCGKELTVGVMHRVDALADRPEGARAANAKSFRSLIPLEEVLAEIHRVGAGSRKVGDAYESLVCHLGSELFILERAPIDELRKAGSTLLAEGITRMREARVIRQAGYDGEYGVIRLFTDDELAQGNSVSLLFDMPASSKGRDRLIAPHSSPLDGPHPLTPSLSPGGGEGALRTGEGEHAEESAKSLPLHEEPPPPASIGSSDALPSALPLGCDPLAGLDPEQRAAATLTDGPLLILAGPGTGKTRTLTHRVAHLVTSKGINPERCLAVTFTNRAANEMKERLYKLIPAAAPSVLVTTFHGLGYRILQEHGARLGLPAAFRVASEAERRALLKEKLQLSDRKASLLLKKLSVWKRVGPAIPGEPSSAQSESGEVGTPRPIEEDRQAFTAYQQMLHKQAWVDFDDLIRLPVELLESQPDLVASYRNRFRWISVDEFQDIDERQYRLVKLLVPADGNLCVIGDPDQAIYGFRGTDVRFFQQFQNDYPTARTVPLRRNYRSGQAIVAGALQAIAPSTLVAGRVLEALSTNDTKLTIHESVTDKAEAEFVVHTIEQLIGGSGFFSLDSGRVAGGGRGGDCSFSDFAVLYRTEAQAGLLCEALARSGIPFQRHSHSSLLEHPAVQAILAAVHELPANQSLLERIRAAALSVMDGHRREKAQGPSRNPQSAIRHESSPPGPGDGVGGLLQLMTVLEPLSQRCDDDLDRFQSELALNLDLDLWDSRADYVSLLTLHASKGLEFAVVFIVGCEDGLLPLRWGAAEDDANLPEERRLLFVGMTRARERLFLSHAKKRLWRGQLRPQALSPFIAAIQQELLELSQAPIFKPAEKPSGEQLDLFANPNNR